MSEAVAEDGPAAHEEACDALLALGGTPDRKNSLPDQPRTLLTIDARHAIRVCADMFADFLMGYACLAASDNGSKLVHSEDVLAALQAPSFHNGFRTDFCHNFSSRWDSRRPTDENSETSSNSESTSPIPSKLLKRRRSTTGLARNSSLTPKRRPKINTVTPSPRIRAGAKSPQQFLYDALTRLPRSPDINQMKPLVQVSYEVANSIVFTASNPILRSAMQLAASPTVSLVANGGNPKKQRIVLPPVKLPASAAPQVEHSAPSRSLNEHQNGVSILKVETKTENISESSIALENLAAFGMVPDNADSSSNLDNVLSNEDSKIEEDEDIDDADETDVGE